MKDQEFIKFSEGESIVFSFSGNISSGKINEILDKAENLLYNDSTLSIKIAKRVYNILVEGLQNLYHHTDEEDPSVVNEYGEKYVNMAITRTEKDIHVYFGNFVNENQKKGLSKRINKIKSLTLEELKQEYKYILSHRQLSAKGGGGMGFYDMAKKANGNIEAEFIPLRKFLYFYILKLIIS